MQSKVFATVARAQHDNAPPSPAAASPPDEKQAERPAMLAMMELLDIDEADFRLLQVLMHTGPTA